MTNRLQAYGMALVMQITSKLPPEVEFVKASVDLHGEISMTIRLTAPIFSELSVLDHRH